MIDCSFMLLLIFSFFIILVDGGWSTWGPWIDCRCPGRSAQGQKRLRTCSNPTPVHSGSPCGGPNIQKTPDCVPCPGLFLILIFIAKKYNKLIN